MGELTQGTKIRLKNGGRRKTRGRRPYTMTMYRYARWYEKEHNDLFGLDPKQVEIILKRFFSHLMQAMVTTGNKYKLPFMLGDMSIAKRKGKIKKPVDWVTTHATGIRTLHQNRHSDGYYARFVWVKHELNSRIHQQATLSLETARYFKRFLASQIKNYNTMNKYYEMSLLYRSKTEYVKMKNKDE